MKESQKKRFWGTKRNLAPAGENGSKPNNENDQLRSKQRDLEHAQQIAHIGNWEMALSSKKITVSKEFYRIFGIDQMKGLSESMIRKAIHPDDVESFYAEVLEAKAVKRPFEFIGRIIRSDGEIRHILAQGIWIVKEAGECTHVFGVAHDITERKKTERELFQTKLLLHDTFDRLNIVLWARNFETKRLLFISEGTENVFGISQKEAFNLNSYAHIVHPDDAGIIEENMYSGDQHLLEYRIIHAKTNEIRWIQTHVSTDMDENFQVSTVYGISVDVTERKRPEEIMNAQNEVLSAIALGKPLSETLLKIAEKTNSKMPGRYCSILLVDQDVNVFTNVVSPQNLWESILNKSIDFMENPCLRAMHLKKPVVVFDLSNDPVWEQTAFRQAAETSGVTSCWAFPVLSADNKVLAIYVSYSQKAGEPKAYELEMIEACIHLTSLAIARKESERNIRKLAFYDSLTGLYNRGQFAEQFNQSLKEAEQASQKLALLFIDLDQFKWINDSLGHDAGDQLLINVANRIKRCIGEEHILARIGGDEFTLLLRNIRSEEEALIVAKGIMDAILEPVSLLEHDVRITSSIGISLYPDHGCTANVMMKQADTAMYQAKSEGRNNVLVYSPSSNDRMYGSFVLQMQLHKALVEDQFVLHYQPRIELKSGAIRSVEALIRWEHPDKGTISPNEFIPMAEESGFIISLGEWVMREACRQNKAWQDHGFPSMRVAVNVSARQFQQESFVSKVQDILSETGMDPEWLEVEITESALMNQEKRIISKLKELNQMGVHVSIDDFGTGYSSLNYLKHFEVKALKIDQSFIRDLLEDPKDEAITKMIIALAHNLQLEVIGEGVETEPQHEFLLLNGCEHAQGFLYCKPLSVSDMEQQLELK